MDLELGLSLNDGIEQKISQGQERNKEQKNLDELRELENFKKKDDIGTYYLQRMGKNVTDITSAINRARIGEFPQGKRSWNIKLFDGSNLKIGKDGPNLGIYLDAGDGMRAIDENHLLGYLTRFTRGAAYANSLRIKKMKELQDEVNNSLKLKQENKRLSESLEEEREELLNNQEEIRRLLDELSTLQSISLSEMLYNKLVQYIKVKLYVIFISAILVFLGYGFLTDILNFNLLTLTLG